LTRPGEFPHGRDHPGDGTWAFDGSTIKVTPGLHRSVPLFRQTYGEVTVPLEAVSGVAFEPERKRGRLRLRLREGADPLRRATGGRLPDAADPYRLTVDVNRAGVAEYLAEEIHRALLLDRISMEPTTAYLLPGPPVPVPARSSDGTVSLDGAQIRVDRSDDSDRVRRATGPRIIGVGDLVRVEWPPDPGTEDGFLRFVTRETVLAEPPPEKDPYALGLWGSARRDLLTALVATAVTARLPHPSTRTARAPHPVPAARREPSPPPGTEQEPEPARPADPRDHGVLLRRLRELDELHRDGVLTDEEFTPTKAAVPRDF
jgi:hypothetical protein